MSGRLGTREIDLKKNLPPEIPLSEIPIGPNDFDGQVQQSEQKEHISDETREQGPEAVDDFQQNSLPAATSSVFIVATIM